MGLPDRRKNTYEELEKRLDHHLEIIEDRFERWFRRGLIAFSIIALCSGAALVGFAINLSKIKQARSEFVQTSCQQTNSRHDRAIGKFNTAAEAAKSQYPDRVAEIDASRDANIGIIEALVPHQNCVYLVKLAEGKATPTPEPKVTKTP